MEVVQGERAPSRRYLGERVADVTADATPNGVICADVSAAGPDRLAAFQHPRGPAIRRLAYVEGEVEGRTGVGEGADGQVVHAGAGHLPGVLQP
jgi:hypothetical protein